MQPESTKNFSGAYKCCRWQPADPRDIAERQSSVFREPLIQTVQSTTRRFRLSNSKGLVQYTDLSVARQDFPLSHHTSSNNLFALNLESLN
jgi:hypothetical protein